MALLLGAVIAIGTAVSLVNADRLMMGKKTVYTMDITAGDAPLKINCEATEVFSRNENFVVVHGYGHRNNTGYGGDGLFRYEPSYNGTQRLTGVATRTTNSYRGYVSTFSDSKEGRDILLACVRQYDKGAPQRL